MPTVAEALAGILPALAEAMPKGERWQDLRAALGLVPMTQLVANKGLNDQRYLALVDELTATCKTAAAFARAIEPPGLPVDRSLAGAVSRLATMIADLKSHQVELSEVDQRAHVMAALAKDCDPDQAVIGSTLARLLGPSAGRELFSLGDPASNPPAPNAV